MPEFVDEDNEEANQDDEEAEVLESRSKGLYDWLFLEGEMWDKLEAMAPASSKDKGGESSDNSDSSDSSYKLK